MYRHTSSNIKVCLFFFKCSWKLHECLYTYTCSLRVHSIYMVIFISRYNIDLQPTYFQNPSCPVSQVSDWAHLISKFLIFHYNNYQFDLKQYNVKYYYKLLQISLKTRKGNIGLCLISLSLILNNGLHWK